MKEIKVISILLISLLIFISLFSTTCLAVEDEETTNRWTDFTNAEFNIKGTLPSIRLEINNINPIHGGTLSPYYFKITNSKEKPIITSIDDLKNDNNWEKAFADNENNSISMLDDFSKYMELNDDMYLWVYEIDNNEYSERVSGYKIEHMIIPNSSELFHSSFLSSVMWQIITPVPHYYKLKTRKVNLKVGLISDNNILQAIKNGESDGYDKLINYVKESKEIYEETLDFYGSDVKTNLTKESDDLYSKIENSKYYYVYVKLDDENGKYYPVEGVTLGLSQKNDVASWWSIHLIDNNDFNWDYLLDKEEINDESNTKNNIQNKNTQEQENGKKDDTVATEPIPQTGVSMVTLVVIFSVSIVGIITYKIYKSIKLK